MISDEYIRYDSFEKRIEKRNHCLIEILNYYISDNSITYWNFMKKVLNEDQQRQVLRFCHKSPIEVTFNSRNRKFLNFFYDVCANLFTPDEVRSFILRSFNEHEITPSMLKYKHLPIVFKILLQTSLDDIKHPGELDECLEKTKFYLDLLKKSMTSEEIFVLDEIILNAEDKKAEFEQKLF